MEVNINITAAVINSNLKNYEFTQPSALWMWCLFVSVYVGLFRTEHRPKWSVGWMTMPRRELPSLVDLGSPRTSWARTKLVYRTDRFGRKILRNVDGFGEPSITRSGVAYSPYLKWKILLFVSFNFVFATLLVIPISKKPLGIWGTEYFNFYCIHLLKL